MTETMSKAQRILALLAEGQTPTEIAAVIGCRDAYVRVVRQRAASPDGITPSDRAWRQKNPDKVREMINRTHRRRYNGDAAYREKQRARCLARRQHMIATDPDFYQKERERGRARWKAKKAEISARRKAWRTERRAIVAAMIEVAYAKT
jgi:hypothetical protein